MVVDHRRDGMVVAAGVGPAGVGAGRAPAVVVTGGPGRRAAVVVRSLDHRRQLPRGVVGVAAGRRLGGGVPAVGVVVPSRPRGDRRRHHHHGRAGGEERPAHARAAPAPAGTRRQERVAPADEADEDEPDAQPHQHVAGVRQREDALPPGQRRVGGVDDGVPRQPGQEEEGTDEAQPKERPQSLGHGPTVRPRTQRHKGT